MSNDLIKQAELRHQRKPRSTLQNEEILPLDKKCTKAELRHQRKPRPTLQNEEILPLDKKCTKLPRALTPVSSEQKQSLPPIRFSSGGHDGAAPTYNLASPTSTKTDDRPRTPRRRNISHGASDGGDNPVKAMRLPIIVCMINDKEYKALVNTGSPHSVIHRRIWDGNSSKYSQMPHICIDGTSFKANFLTDDMSIHDVILGMDFICNNKCILDFKNNTLCLNDDTTTSFLKEEDLPMKYRSSPRTNLTASM